jgi:hypothetical protein
MTARGGEGGYLPLTDSRVILEMVRDWHADWGDLLDELADEVYGAEAVGVDEEE